MGFKNNKYYVIFIHNILPVLLYKIIPVVFIVLCFIHINSDIYLCDDTNRETIWGGELDGTPKYKYEPYRPGLQSTSQGYRYEMDGNNNCSSSPSYHTDMKNHSNIYNLGDKKPNYPYGPDSYNNRPYESQSTQLGEIEYTQSELDRGGYYQGSRLSTAEYYVKPDLFGIKGAWNYLKKDLEKTREKYQARRERNDRLYADAPWSYKYREARYARESEQLRAKWGNHLEERKIKVRRFD